MRLHHDNYNVVTCQNNNSYTSIYIYPTVIIVLGARLSLERRESGLVPIGEWCFHTPQSNKIVKVGVM